MVNEKNNVKMFTGLPSPIYIAVAWTAYWYTIYAYGVGVAYYNWNAVK